MKTSDGGLFFDSGIDTKGLAADADKVKRELKSIGQTAVTETSRMDGMFKNVLAGAAGALTIQAAMQFRTKLIDVRGEFQKYEAVLTNSLGSQKDATDSMKMLSDIASKTPFQLNSLTGSYVKLVNQGFKPTRIELIKMGDLASSTGKDFDQLTEAILDAQAGQFERLKEFGIKASVSGDQVSFSFKGITTTVKNSSDAIRAYMLSLGDMQGVKGSMEAISKTLVGQVSNLEDKITAMFNSIGTSSEGLLSASISGASLLVDNYEEIAKIIGVLIGTYGAYKAAVIVTTAVETAATMATKGWTVAEVLHFNVMKMAAAAQSILNRTMLANPYVAVATALAGLITYMVLFKKETKDITEAQREFKENSSKSVAEMTSLFDQLKKTNVGTDERRKVIEQLNGKYGEYLQNMNLETAALGDIEKAEKAASNAMLARMANEGKTKDLTDITSRKLETLKAIQSKATKAEFEEINKYIEDASKPATYTPDKVTGKLKSNFVFKSWGQDIDNLLLSLDALKQQESEVNKSWDSLLSTMEQPVESSVSVNKSGKPTTEIKKEAEERSKAQEEVLKNDLEYQKRKQEIEFNTRQDNINLIADSGQKEIEQARLNFDKKIAELDRQEAEYLTFLKDVAQKEYEAKGGKGKLDVSKVSISDDIKTAFNSQRSAAGQEQAATIAKSLLDDLKQKNEERKKLADQGSDYEIKAYAEGVREMTRIGVDGLKNYMVIIKAKIDLLKLEGKNVTELENAYKEAEKALKAPQPTSWVKLDKFVQNVTQSVSFLGQTLQETGGTMGEIGGVISTLANSYQDLTTAIKLSAKASKEGLSSEEKGQMVSSAINAATNIYNMIASQVKANKEAQKEWNAKIAEGVQQARLLRIEHDAYKQENIFGIENPYARAIAGAKQYGDAMAELQKMGGEMEGGQVQTGTTQKVSGSNVATGAASGAVIGAAVGSVIPVVGNVVGAVVGAVVGGIVGLLNRKTVPVFESLKSQYKEIYNKDTFELNPQILADYNKLDEATKELVDNWGEIKDKAKAARDDMEQNFKDLAGDIGKNLSDALVNAFKNGDVYGAMDDFKKYMLSIIENIVSEMIFAKTVGVALTKLGNDFNASFGLDENGIYVGGGDGSITDDIERFYSSLPGYVAQYNAAMTGVQTSSKGTQWGLFQGGSSSSQSAASTGAAISTMSQDSATALEGRFTALQMIGSDSLNLFKSVVPDIQDIKFNTGLMSGNEANYTPVINVTSDISPSLSTIQDNTRITAEVIREQRNIALESMNHLADINKNTKQLYDTNEKLDKIVKNTSRL